ncbi:hypothetical protein Micbo1qcDRAFT_125578 [Microdochium bolleyi]|uniref:D-arabinitol 2-dehydrogenase [ribulose-forming] n=1 Tax=Microdochium bolleyi TaxID=196109 RepID=A0A136IPT8_9PEZI|nr:hypothetical protein Micbo1qcDRAFT_125578 [Microdochium bolleyi]
MILGDGSPGSLSAPPAPLSGNAAERAVARFSLDGKNAIVTGGAGDLGFSVSKALLEHGVSGLVIFDMNPADAQAKVSLLASEFPGARIDFQRVDITDEQGVGTAVDKVVALLGSVDILLNFAGMVCCGHAVDLAAKDWNRVIAVNTIGGFNVAKAVAKAMIERKAGGSMVFVASISAHQVNFPQPQVPYNVSKAGVKMRVQSLAAEWAVHGIRVNSISPGYMDTILNEGDGLDVARNAWASRCPMGRMGQPDELSGLVVMLASRAGSYITGADILVDGGQTLLM